MQMMCPICHELITLEVNPEDNSRLIGKCGHFPGGLPKEIIDVPNPDYVEPEKPVKKVKGDKA